MTTSTRRRSRTSRAVTDAAASTATSNDSASCAPGVHVEHDRGARTPPRLVLADHQLAGARGRAPVHAPQVVAHLVVAQGHELVAEIAHDRARRRRLVLGADAAPDRDRRHDLVHARAHDELRLARARLAAAGETERVGDRHREGTDAVAAAPTGRDAVRGAGGRPGRERRDEEARRAPAFVEPVGGGEQGSGPRRPGSRPGGRCGPRSRRGGGRVAPAGSPPARVGSGTAATARPRPRARARRCPSTSISSAPSRKLPTTSPHRRAGERPAASGQRVIAASSRARWAGPR